MITLNKPKSLGISRVALRRSLCRESYFDFMQEFWPTLGVQEDPVWNWHIRIMCHEVQKVCERIIAGLPKRYDLIINVPPGSTKSLTCSVMLLPWLWTRMPGFRFLGGSFNSDLALDFGNKARNIIKHELYQETFPEIKISDDQDTKGYFRNTFGGERYSTSTGSSIIGRHFHLHSIDDPINPKGARSAVELKETNTWLSEAVAQRCVSRAITAMILTMQRLNVEDPSGVRLERVGGTPVRHLCLPAEVSDNVFPSILKSKYKDGLLDPIRLPRSILQGIKEGELTPYEYSGQYEQRPVPLTGGMIPVDKLRFANEPPSPDKFNYVMRWWDKAASQGTGDYTVGVLMGIKKDTNDFPIYWVLDVVRKQISTTEREALIRRTAESDRVKYEDIYKIGLEQEPGSGGKDSVLYTTQRLDGFHVISERSTGSKLDRAHEFATQVGAENVGVVDRPWKKTYVEELQFFGPLCKHDDQVDATSGAFNFLAKRKFVFGAVNF